MIEGNGKDRGKGSCERCEWSWRDAIGKDQTLYCRRRPPGVIFMGMAQTLAGQATPMTAGAFPAVQPHMWCGEFEPRIADSTSRLDDLKRQLANTTPP